jgi:hypothetical protein
MRIERTGDDSAEAIFALQSSTPAGVAGLADDAGDVEVE